MLVKFLNPLLVPALIAFVSVAILPERASSNSLRLTKAENGTIAFADGPISLQAGATQVKLQQTHSDLSLPQRLSQLAPNHRMFLVVRDLRVTAQPGVLYRIYLDLPAGAKPARNDPHFAGTLNFFGAADSSRGDSPKVSSLFVSYDVTPVLQNLVSRKLLSDAITLTIIPSGAPASDANPTIGRIELVEQN